MMSSKILEYEITDTLYESKSTLVYRGYHTQNSLPVILKVLKAEAATIYQRDVFKHEFEIIAKLNMPGVAKHIALADHEDGLVMVMEDFGGQSLDHMLYTSPLSLESILTWAISLADTIGLLHQQHIIHKNINPSNIVCNPNTGQINLIDFKLADEVPDRSIAPTPPSALEGTLEYISPEQTGRMNRPVDYRTDYYSLGVTFYIMLTNQLPFKADDALGMLHCHIAMKPVPPHELDQSIPKMVSEIVMKLMAKMADDRYQSTWGLRKDLEKCLSELRNKGTVQRFELGREDFSGQLQIPQKLYGREKELAQLLKAFDKVSTGEYELFLVAGYSGIGKTSLVHEIHRPITQKRGYFIEGKFDQLQRNVPFFAWIQAFDEFVNYLLMENEELLAYWKEIMLSVVGNIGRVLTDVIPNLELIIGIQPQVPALGANEAQNRFNYLFLKFIKIIACKEHPLVIFLDDLQWIDTASLNLLQILTNDTSVSHLLLIGAYRNNEVDALHPLTIAMDALRKNQKNIDLLTIRNLSEETVNKLMLESFHRGHFETQEISRMIYVKTGGNPFFLHQTLKAMVEKKSIFFDDNSKHWKWDVSILNGVGITDNIVMLMTEKIRLLPLNAQQILPLAACIGYRFSLSHLGVVTEKSEEAVLTSLQSPLREGLITSLREGEYEFVHDRVQQAAYSLIPNNEKKLIHLSIGKHLLNNIKGNELDEKIFQIVTHLNLGCDLLQREQEKLELAKLNLKAGIKAKQSNAPSISSRYLQAGVKLLPTDLWSKHYPLALELYKHKAQANFLSGKFDEAKQEFSTLLDHAIGKYDKADIYLIRMIQFAQLGEYKKCYDIGVKIMRSFMYSLPDISTPDKIEQAMTTSVAKFKELLGDRSWSQIKDLPDIIDKDQSYLIKILSHISDAVYIALPPIFPLVIFDIVNISIKYGFNHFSALGFCWLPVLLGMVLKDYHMGYESGQLSLTLNKRYENAQLKSSTLFLSTVFTIHWKFHAKMALQYYTEAFKIGVNNGEKTYSGYARVMIPKTLLDIGIQINTIKEENQRSIDFLAKSKSIFIEEEQFFREFLNNLTNTHELKTNFDCSEFKEKEYLKKWQSVTFGHGLGYYLSYKTQNLFLFEKFEEAYGIGLKHQEWTQFIATLYEETQFYFYHTLCATAIYLKCDDEKKKQVWATIKENEEKFGTWAVVCPDNFKHKHLLIQAEIARLQGQKQEAIYFYHQAIESAQEFNYINNVAVIHELAERFWLSEGYEDYARLHLMNAYQGYTKWQVWAKVSALETKFPQWLDPKTNENTLPETISLDKNTTILDLDTVIKASHIISSEMEMDNLLSKVMRIVIENAGAQSGFLLMEKDDEWIIAAKGDINSISVDVSMQIRINESEEVSLGIIRYVERTNETIVLDDAATQGEFANDSHVRSKRTKSLLCAPLLSRGKLVGILYLENNLATHAFTSQRIRLLEMLLSQAATSLENAGVYKALKDSEQKFHAIFDQTFQFIGMLTPEGIVLQSNQTSLQFAGISKEEVIGKPFWETPWWKHSVKLQQRLHTAVIEAAGGRLVRFEATHHMPNGDIRYVDFSIKPITDANGQVVQLIPEGRDITERKLAEEALRESRQRLDNIVANSPGAIYRCANDPEWTIEFLSAAITRITGYPVDDFLNNHVRSYLCIIYPDDRYRVKETMTACLRRKDRYNIDYRIVTADGTLRWVNEQGLGSFTSYGRLLYLDGIIFDISAERQAEKALKKSEALLNDSQHLAKVGGWEFDIKSSKSFWTDELYLIHEIPKNPDLDHLSESQNCYRPEDRQVITEAFQKACEEGEPYDLEFPFTTFKGKNLWVRTTAHPIYEEGKVVSLMGNVIDITESKRTEEEIHKLNQELEQRVLERTRQLEIVNKELESFSYSVSHDLRAPLRSIDGFSQVLLEEFNDKLNKQGQNYLQRVRASAQRMAQLIDDMLSLSKVSQGDLNIQPVNLSDIAHEIANELHNLDLNREVKISIQNEIIVNVDERLIRIVLENLLQNAWKYTSKHPTAYIEVGTLLQNDKQVIFVRDDGAGFNMKYAKKLFGAFQRLHDSKEFQGTGVGLATVQRIIHRHSGTIWAEGEIEKGATFYFTIPQ